MATGSNWFTNWRGSWGVGTPNLPGEGVPYRQGGPSREFLDALNARAEQLTGIRTTYQVDNQGRLLLSPDFAEMFGYRIQVNLANMVLTTANAAGKSVINGVRVLAEAIAMESSDYSHIRQANRILAIEMRKALMQGYGQSVERRKQVPSYPRQNRLSGALKRAISSSDMAIGDESGIKYINQDRLNTEARHWARINYGVRGAPGASRGSATTPPPKQFPLLSTGGDDVGIGTIGLRANPRPPMYLPPGFWEFIGGRATGRENRRKKPDLGPDDDDDRSSVRDAAAERRRARMAARLGGSAPVESAQRRTSDGGKYNSPFYYASQARKTTGRSPWGRDYGGYPKSRTFKRSYTLSTGRKREREVTQVSYGIRRSRQKFQPTGGGSFGSKPRFPTRGVVGANYLDHGLRALAQHADRVYFEMAQQIINDSATKAQKKRWEKLMVKWDAQMEAIKIQTQAKKRGGTYAQGGIDDVLRDFFRD